MDDGRNLGDVVVPLSALGRHDIDICGGKAANLGEMIHAGFPVPDGFCVTTEAYRRATDLPAMQAILDAIASAPAAETATLDSLAARARQAITEAPIPEDVALAVKAAYSELGDGEPVAVRSSATAEDLPDASFAGQQDTYLNIQGVTPLLDATRRCWASLWTDRAVSYRAKNGIDPRAVRLAVVVQKMAPAAASGVMFTADPVTGKRRRAVIDASPGLGEAVVSGAVNPDHFEVDSEAMRIESRLLGDKKMSIEASPGGGTRHVTRRDGGERACLSDEEILALADLGKRVEAHYGAPQDTEWALGRDRELYLLQSRPITTLFPLPKATLEREAAAPDGELAPARVYLNFNVAQGVFQPFTPMGIQSWRVITAGISAMGGFPYDDPEAGPPALTDAAGRIFVDLTSVVRSDIGRQALSFAFQRMEARSFAMLDALFDDPRFSVEKTSRWGLVKRFGRIFARTKMPVTALRYVVSPEGVPGVCRTAADRALVLGDVARDATPRDRLEAAKSLLLHGPSKMIPVIVPALIAGMLCWRAANKLLEGIATPEELETTFRGLPHNPTTTMDMELWAISTRLREDPASLAALRDLPPSELSTRYLKGELPASLHRELNAFLREYGARGVAEIDLGVPRWRDDPTHVLGVLANYVTHPEGAVPPDEQFRRIEREAESMVETLTRRAEERDPLRGDVVGFLLSRMRALAGLREAPKFYMVRLLGRTRALLADVGRSLVERGSLNSPEDIFMVDLSEAREALGGRDLKAIVTERRVAWIRDRGRRNLPRLYLSDGTEPVPKGKVEAQPEGQLTGTPASTGQVTARARVVLEPNGAKLTRGEILVAPSTDPGWTPLFLTAGGLVMEMGGAMSHGAVVAREYGIPAVVGVADATVRIQTGDKVFVDGAAGVVRILRDDGEGG